MTNASWSRDQFVVFGTSERPDERSLLAESSSIHPRPATVWALRANEREEARMKLGATGLVAMLLVGVAGLESVFAETPSSGPPSPEPTLPPFLKDRGIGVPLSMFGTYIRRGELVAYPFFEYYRDHDFEYKPSELGAPGEEDFRGRYRANEELLFLAYGFTDNLALEMEAAVIQATFEKAPADPSALPPLIEESGLGDVEGQLRFRWKRETERRPELFSYFEFTFPHAEDRPLTGTPGWEFKLGTGVTRGFSWGTLTARFAVEYSEASSSHFDTGEYAVEYLKRVSPSFRFYVGLEGAQDELSLITEVQWHITGSVCLKLNNGLGLTSKATDWSPEVGILFTLPSRSMH
jgi:hypothetical protein